MRSLGRRGIPICVIDDGRAIARSSQYATHVLNAPSIRNQDETVDFVLKAAERLDLQGWVLFPTRDEHVAAFARSRDRLAQRYRVPTPCWDSIKWAWNKKNTYQLAERL